MRQAGRYMSVYRELRKRHTLLALCHQPELAVEVTLQPINAIDVDAAILFSDLLLPFTPIGLDFDFVKGEGPQIKNPIRSSADVERLRRVELREALAHVLETIRLVRRELDGKVPLIGFGGAPFTLAAYAIEGGPSKSYPLTKAFMSSNAPAWHRLCGLLAEVMADYLQAQVDAGAQAIQVFDSWAGMLSREDYREFALPHSSWLFAELASTIGTAGVPMLHFGVGTTAILREMREAGGDVIGVDWRQPIDDAWSVIGHDRGVQGNLDPTLLLGPRDRMLSAASDVLHRVGNRPGHIFNLGHGVLPETNLEDVQALARHVHERSRRLE